MGTILQQLSVCKENLEKKKQLCLQTNVQQLPVEL
jgi:hypothetical protein